MEVLTQTKQFFACCGLWNEEYVKIGRKKIPKSTIRLILLVVQICFAYPEIVCITNNREIGLLVMVSIHRLIHYVVHFTNYCVCIANIDKIVELTKYLQEVVVNRKHFDHISSVFETTFHVCL